MIIVLLVYVLSTQEKNLRSSLHTIRHADSSDIFLGIGLALATFFVAATIYQALALHPLRYRRTLLIQVASGFTNRLLPAGLGGIGLIAQYLRTQKHTTSEAVTVVGVDNIVGIIGHFMLFFVTVVLANVSSTAVHGPHISWIFVVASILVLAFFGLQRHIREAIQKFFTSIGHDLKGYWHHPIKLMLAFLSSLLLTVLYVGTLWACARGVGAALSFPKILVVFTAGSLLGNATPTPGGLVGVEAGLFGGFVAYGVSSGAALAAAILYRLLTYWLPIVPGVVAFWIAQRKFNLLLGPAKAR